MLGQSVHRGGGAGSWPGGASVDSGAVSGSFAQRLLAELRADIPLHLIVAAYAGAVFLVAQTLGRPEKFELLMYAERWIIVLPGLVLPGIACIGVVCAVITHPRAPFTGLVRFLCHPRGPRLAAGLVLFTSVTLFYGAFTSAKNLLPEVSHFDWDVALADLGEWMHGGTPLWRHLHPVLTPYTRYIDIFYNVFWQVAMLTMVLAMAFANQRRRRFFIIFFLCWIVLGNVLAGMFYSAGPIFYDRVVGDAQRFRFLLDYIGGYQDPPLAVSVYQSYLWTLHRLGAPEFGSGISAFPSMHVSMATLIALWLTRMHRRLAIPAVLMVLLTQAGSVHLGWHYAVDGYASIVLTYLIWRTVDQAASRQPVRRTAPPAALDGAMAPAGAGG